MRGLQLLQGYALRRFVLLCIVPISSQVNLRGAYTEYIVENGGTVERYTKPFPAPPLGRQFDPCDIAAVTTESSSTFNILQCSCTGTKFVCTHAGLSLLDQRGNDSSDIVVKAYVVA